MTVVTDAPFDTVQSNFVMFSPDNVDPSKIPDYIRCYYDYAFDMHMRFRHFAGCRDIPANFWPIICLLAEQQKRIDDLEEALEQRHSTSSSPGSAGGAAVKAVAPRRGPGRPPKQELKTDGG